ncbi:MAG: penicillin-binding protein 2 [Thermoleophilia bacterium]|nr:penicillin-binding protein 2 [Thermoleophilia bacterium]
MNMNQRMARVFSVLLATFAAIVLLLSWWQLLAAGELRAKSSNNQRAYYEQRVKRGEIVSADGVVLARSRSETTKNGDVVWHRRYPERALAAHATGYSTIGRSRSGVEKSFNDYLTGPTRELATVISKLRGEDAIEGDSLKLTLDARAQRVAVKALGTRRGSVVALDPTTGKVLVMASTPGYDPNRVENGYGSILKNPGAPLLNRSTQALYPPGSTFKVVVAAAALADGVKPTDTFPGGTMVKVKSGPPVSNYFNESVRSHDLTYALTNSVNITFARLGEQLGQTRLRKQMDAFGFDESPPLDDLPSNERKTSGLYDPVSGKLMGADEGVDEARFAIGQERLLVTPLQMAMVAAAIANHGELMKPYLVDSASAPDGHRSYTAQPQKDRTAISRPVADELTTMMQQVVKEGTGTAAALQGLDVAGKTGTADKGNTVQVWFIAFVPGEKSRVAIAVTIEGQAPGSVGGTIAAPVAKLVMESLLRSHA